MPKYRAQILLEPEQHQALAEIAEQREQSISHLVREIIQKYLVRADLDVRKHREIQAIQELAAIRAEIQARCGMLPEDLLEEARRERENEIWREEE